MADNFNDQNTPSENSGENLEPQAPFTVDNENNTPKKGNLKGLAVASMIIGIVSIVLSLTIYFSIPLAIISIILGIIALVKKADGKEKAIAGIICSAVGIILVIIMLVMIFRIYGTVADMFGISIFELLKKVGSGEISQEELTQLILSSKG